MLWVHILLIVSLIFLIKTECQPVKGNLQKNKNKEVKISQPIHRTTSSVESFGVSLTNFPKPLIFPSTQEGKKQINKPEVKAKIREHGEQLHAWHSTSGETTNTFAFTRLAKNTEPSQQQIPENSTKRKISQAFAKVKAKIPFKKSTQR